MPLTDVESKFKLTGPGKPGPQYRKDMRFKIDKNLLAIANLIPDFPEIKPAEEIAVEMCQYFVNAGIIEDTPDHWGESVLIASGPQYVKDVCDLLAGYLHVSSIKSDVFDAFCRLIVLGDGDCPVCGGNLIFDEIEGHELKDGDYWTPNSWVTDLYVYHCANCGEIYKTKNEL